MTAHIMLYYHSVRWNSLTPARVSLILNRSVHGHSTQNCNSLHVSSVWYTAAVYLFLPNR